MCLATSRSLHLELDDRSVRIWDGHTLGDARVPFQPRRMVSHWALAEEVGRKGVSLICSDLFCKQIGTNRKKSEQNGTNQNNLGRAFPKTRNANRNKSEESGEIGANPNT